MLATKLTIDTNKPINEVNFAPNKVQEIMQNVRTILRTTKYSVPLNRGFGIDGNIIDLPLPLAKAKMINEIINAIKKYEPRVEVIKIDFKSAINTETNTDELDGVLHPKVTIRIKNG